MAKKHKPRQTILNIIQEVERVILPIIYKQFNTKLGTDPNLFDYLETLSADEQEILMNKMTSDGVVFFDLLLNFHSLRRGDL